MSLLKTLYLLYNTFSLSQNIAQNISTCGRSHCSSGKHVVTQTRLDAFNIFLGLKFQKIVVRKTKLKTLF